MSTPVPDVFHGLRLPASALDLVKARPIEDVGLAILRRGLPDVPTYALIPKTTPEFFLIVRGIPELGNYRSGHGLWNQNDFAVHAYAQDPEGDEQAALLSFAVVSVMEQAFREHWRLPGLGTVNKIECFQGPTREPDWATSTGPVQYADLPTGDWRYEARFRARINTPRVLAD